MKEMTNRITIEIAQTMESMQKFIKDELTKVY
jgi:hypothetical protein